MKPAVFLDRDGTLIEHVHYLDDPDAVRLLPGTAEALVMLRQAGYLAIVVTNQSGIARGYLNESTLEQIHRVMQQQLSRAGATLDAIYYCPHCPQSADRGVVDFFDRKPGPGMLIRAALEHEIALGASWMIGDAVSDVLAGQHAGCRGSILVQTGMEPVAADDPRCPHVLPDLLTAARWILEQPPLT